MWPFGKKEPDEKEIKREAATQRRKELADEVEQALNEMLRENQDA